MHHGKSGVNKLLIKKFWKRRKVLIIGHTGFKGSWLIIFLNFLGSHVYGYSLKPVKNHIIFNKLKLKNFLKLNCYADINDTKKLKRFIINRKNMGKKTKRGGASIFEKVPFINEVNKKSKQLIEDRSERELDSIKLTSVRILKANLR